jgi:hypothetical protein
MAAPSSISGSEFMTPGSRRHVVIFLAVLLALFGGLVAVTSRLVLDLRRDPFDFTAMAPHEVLFPQRITRRQEAELKVGFAEQHQPSIVGLFGNHQVQYFNTDAFPADITARYGADRLFFNHWFADLTLVDLLDYLTYLESIGKLPEKLIVVGITTPNNDNGLHIVSRSWHLPSDIRYTAEQGVSIGRVADLVSQRAQEILLAARYYTDYMSAISALSQRDYKLRAQDSRLCEGKVLANVATERRGPLASLPLPGTLVNMFAGPSPLAFCATARGLFRRDGATATDRMDPAKAEVVLNENPLDARRTGLHDGDEKIIAGTLQAIARIGERAGRKVVFLIPPVHETDRIGASDLVFSAALRLVPHLDVIDDRRAHREKENFWEYDHPNEKYYRHVARALSDRYLRD